MGGASSFPPNSVAARGVLAERARQQAPAPGEGFPPEHDDGYVRGELVKAAVAIATADSFDGTYRDIGQMIEAMIGRVALTARELGWSGFALADFEQRKPAAGALNSDADTFVIVVKPAPRGAATIDECRAFLKERRARELVKREQGELL